MDVRAFIHGMWAHLAPAWGAHADDVERRAGVIADRLLGGAGVGPGDRVLELACGPGGAGLAAAARVGAAGEVIVSDVVPAMVDIAVSRAGARGLTNVRGKVLDLEDIAEPDGAFDVVLCREGMMFAVDPARAAQEMVRTLRPGGRVAVSVWAPKAENPWLGLLLDAIAEVTGTIVPRPGMPGPFALGDRDTFRALFVNAGVTDLDLGAMAAPLRAPSFDAWWQRNLTVAGPVVAVLEKLDEPARARVRDTARNAAQPYLTDGGLELPGLALVLTGRRG
jgi:SAM-dependent methyltransferase